jgi:hypothetical protein
MKRAIAALPFLARDAAGIGGAGLVAYGSWLIFPPAGYIAGGLLLLVGAWISASKDTP